VFNNKKQNIIGKILLIFIATSTIFYSVSAQQKDHTLQPESFLSQQNNVCLIQRWPLYSSIFIFLF